jgi:hypothetical protein
MTETALTIAAPASVPAASEPVARDDLVRICAETYQVLGIVADRAGMFDDGGVIKAMNNLCEQRLVHEDVLPFEPTPHPPSASSDEQDARPYDEAVDALRRRINELPRFSFLLDSNGNVVRVPSRTGNWIDWQSAHELFDPEMVDAQVDKMRTAEIKRMLLATCDEAIANKNAALSTPPRAEDGESD